MDYFAGVDIGTSSVKALALGPGGKTLGAYRQAYPAHTDTTGRHEEDPEVIFEATLSVLRSLLSSLPGQLPACVSFSAAMHGLLALDDGGKPLSPLITWADTRAAPEAESFRGTEAAREIYRLTGTPIHPMSPLVKLRWLRKAQPDVFARAARFVSIKEYVWYRLFGTYEVDRSIASATGLFDTQAGRWCAPALEAAGIDERRLSEPVAVTFRRESPVFGSAFVIGAGDGCLANLGTGVVSPGEAAVTIGTSGAVRIVTGDWGPDPEERLFEYWLTEGAYVKGGAVNNGGNLLDWFSGLTGEPLDSALDSAFALPDGSQGLLFLPYLYGERAPMWDAGARGAFVGLRAYHGKAHLLRAVTEGIGYSLYESLRLLEPIHTVYASGGFTRSGAWVQQLADTFGRTVCLTEEDDASATGAAFLGMLALGVLPGLSALPVRAGQTYRPRPERTTYHQRNYALYQRLYPMLRPIFHDLD